MTADPNSPQVIAKLLSEQDAAMVINHLRAVGIEAHAWNTNLQSAWEAGPFAVVEVVVRQGDSDRAWEALADLQCTRSQVNWDEIDVGEPE